MIENCLKRILPLRRTVVFDGRHPFVRRQRNAHNQQRNAYTYEARRDRQIQMSASGSAYGQAVIMNHIKVINGASMGKDAVLNAIGQYVEDLKPILLKVERNDVSFFIEDNEIASAIQSISRRLVDPKTGFHITIVSSRKPVGYSALKNSDVRILESVLNKRYNAKNCSLDLSHLQLESETRMKSLHLSLNRSCVMMAVIEIIDKHYGNITALSLKGNALRFLDFLSSLLYRTKNIVELDLSSNDISKLSELEKLKGWPIQKLFLENNPFCSTYAVADDYIEAVRKMFPRITLLDGVTISLSPNMPDLDSESNLPPIKPCFYGSFAGAERKELIESFLLEYYRYYDNPDVTERKNLMQAYDENATFSLSIENLPESKDEIISYDQTMFQIYRKVSHNITHVDKWSRYREKLVFRGSMDIIVQLRKLPLTKHILNSFIVDVSLITPSNICFTVHGFFFDGRDQVNESNMRLFCRDFIVANKGDGKISVVSDILFISAVKTQRIERYKRILEKISKEPVVEKEPKSGMSDVKPSTSSSPFTSSDNAAEQLIRLANSGDSKSQEMLIEAFSKESKMKPDWAKKCLLDHNWNYESAGKAFLAVYDKIPAEAFQN